MDYNNTTTTEVPEEPSEEFSLWVKVTFGLFISIMFLLNIVGNSITIIAFYRDAKLKTVQNYFICNLAITDLIIGLSSIPFYAVYTIMYFYWPFTYIFCKIWCVIDFWVVAESSLTIILISYDRLQMVTRGPMYMAEQTKKNALIKIGVSWFISFILYSPAIIGYNHWRGTSTVDENDCDVEFSTEFWYTLITAMIEFWIPFILLATFNGMIYWNIRKRTIKKTTNVDASLKKDRQVAKSLLILVVCYGVCWIPYTVTVIIITFCGDCVNETLFECFNWLLWLNSSINPIVYAGTSPRFRAHYKNMLCFCTGRKVRPVNESVKDSKKMNKKNDTTQIQI